MVSVNMVNVKDKCFPIPILNPAFFTFCMTGPYTANILFFQILRLDF